MNYDDLVRAFKLLGLLAYEVSDGIMISVQSKDESDIVEAILKFKDITNYESIFNSAEEEDESGYNMIRQRVYFNQEAKFIKVYSCKKI